MLSEQARKAADKVIGLMRASDDFQRELKHIRTNREVRKRIARRNARMALSDLRASHRNTNWRGLSDFEVDSFIRPRADELSDLRRMGLSVFAAIDDISDVEASYALPDVGLVKDVIRREEAVIRRCELV